MAGDVRAALRGGGWDGRVVVAAVVSPPVAEAAGRTGRFTGLPSPARRRGARGSQPGVPRPDAPARDKRMTDALRRPAGLVGTAPTARRASAKDLFDCSLAPAGGNIEEEVHAFIIVMLVFFILPPPEACLSGTSRVVLETAVMGASCFACAPKARQDYRIHGRMTQRA